jgi:hypothetical protein
MAACNGACTLGSTGVICIVGSFAWLFTAGSLMALPVEPREGRGGLPPPHPIVAAQASQPAVVEEVTRTENADGTVNVFTKVRNSKV